jgi:hypothetical protein
MPSLYCECIEPIFRSDDVCNKCGNKKLKEAIARETTNPKTRNTQINHTKPSTDVSGEKSHSKNTSENTEMTSAQLEKIIEAQNRTTHAVRAFVRFLFIQLSGLTLAVFIWNISNLFIDQQECINYGRQCSGNGFLRFLAVVIGFVTIYWSSAAGWKELEKSKIN